MADFPSVLSNVADNTDDVMAKYINNIEALLGINGSAVTTSHAYKLSGVTSSDKAASLAGAETFTNKTLTSPKIGTAILDTNGNEIIKTPATGSAVNEVTITNAVANGHPNISATGDNTNINLKLTPKGTGTININKAATSSQTPQMDINSVTKFFSLKDNFVNLGTTPVSIHGGTTVSSCIMFMRLAVVNGSTADFIIFSEIDAGIAWRFNVVVGANCSITQSPAGTFTITGLGDGHTYILKLSAGSAIGTFEAEGTITGTTALSCLGITIAD